MLAPTLSGTCVAQGQKDREFQECPECPVMVGIPAGKFVMGSPREHGRFDSEGPQHEVTIKAFALGKYNVTSEQFLTFLRETGYQPSACNSILDMKWNSPGHGRAYAPYSGEPPRWPAVCLDWHDAEKYIVWLNDKVRVAHPALDHTKAVYRLPTEAEWEYAARAGTTTAALLGERHRRRQGQLQRLRQQVGQSALGRRRQFCPQPLRALRHARQRLAMNRRLLARQLCGRAGRRERVDRGELRQARHSRRVLGQVADFHSLLGAEW
ncbi:MAG: formylglycine-generating enzyme family protein [Methyloceanibacter sp.]